MPSRNNCAYCHRRFGKDPTALNGRSRDHLVPRSQGGVDTVFCCRRCNGLKGDMTPDQWNEFRAQHPDWRQMMPGEGDLWLAQRRAAERGQDARAHLLAYRLENKLRWRGPAHG